MPQHRIGTFVLGAFWALSAIGCGNPVQPAGSPTVQVAEDSVAVAIGDSLRLHLLSMLPPGYVPPVTWSSSDSATASVEKEGTLAAVVRGVRVGQAVITAAGEGARDSVLVTVEAAAPPSF